MTNDLKKHLENNPDIFNVWVNPKGEWQFYPKPGYSTKYSREEVLDMEVASETEEVPDKAKLQTKPGKVKAVADKEEGASE